MSSSSIFNRSKMQSIINFLLSSYSKYAYELDASCAIDFATILVSSGFYGLMFYVIVNQI
jgi:hypothetical protein